MTKEKQPILDRTFSRTSTGLKGASDAETFKHHELQGDHVYFSVVLKVDGADPRIQYARLPGHHELQASTPPGMASPIRIEHRYKVSVGFLLYDQPRTFTLLKPILLSSCLCTSANVFLPAYEDQRDGKTPACACFQTIEEVVADRKSWPNPEAIPTQTDDPDARPKAAYDS